jgi:hypothetical protein
MAQGCPERVSWGFIHWIRTYGKRKRPGFLAQLKTAESEKTVVILRSTREIRSTFPASARVTPTTRPEAQQHAWTVDQRGVMC